MAGKKAITAGLILYCIMLGWSPGGGLHASAEKRLVPRHSQNKPALDSRWGLIARQEFDYSCGAAALATLLRLQFKESVTENLVLNEIMRGLSKKQIADRRKHGLSLLDLKKYSRGKGYSAVALILDVSAPLKLGMPIIVLLDNGISQHFAVLKCIQKGKASLADPARGNIQMPIKLFLQEWRGVALVLERESPRRGLADKPLSGFEKRAPIRR